MKYLNLTIEDLTSAEFLGCEPLDRATWLCMLRYCAQHETGGTIPGAGAWGDRKWQQVCGVTLAEVQRECTLWTWAGPDVQLWHYPEQQERAAKSRRQAGQMYGRGHGKANPYIAPEQAPEQAPESAPDSPPNRSPNRSPDSPPDSSALAKDKDKDKDKGKKKKPRGRSRAAAHDDAVTGAKIPDALNTPGFRELWDKWTAQRRNPRQYMTTAAVEQALAKCEHYGVTAACAALRDALVGTYAGLFPERYAGKQRNLALGQCHDDGGAVRRPTHKR